jgi:glycosyltransferase involved in cell wall biosynthesis
VLGSDFGLLRMPGMTGMLRRAFARRRTFLAPNADWMAARLEANFGGVADIRPNPFGVSPDWFDVPRKPSDSRDWLVVSRVTRRKLGDLTEWGEGLFGETRRLRLLGPMQEQLPLPRWIEYGGSTDPGALRGRWLPHAAGLLTLSRHDEGRPQIMIEAMAAGLPVIASAITAHVDLVRHAETGWLVDSRQALVEALAQAETPSIARDVGQRAQTWIREHIGTWDEYAHRCIDAYRELLQPESVNAS